jgi:hypothetical protein
LVQQKATVTAATTTGLKVTVPVGANFAPVSVVNGERALIAYSSNNFNPAFYSLEVYSKGF